MSACICESARLPDGWMLPCSWVDEDGPCRYHQGAADALASLERWLSDVKSRKPQADSVVDALPEKARLRLFGQGVVRGMMEAHEQVTLWVLQAGANR